MIEITKKLNIDEVSEMRKISEAQTFEFSSHDGWEVCYAAAALWFAENDCVLISTGHYEDYIDGDYCLYISVEDVEKKDQ